MGKTLLRMVGDERACCAQNFQQNEQLRAGGGANRPVSRGGFPRWEQFQSLGVIRVCGGG